MALPNNMRLKGHRTFNYIHQNSTTYHGALMNFKVARSKPGILLSHNFKNTRHGSPTHKNTDNSACAASCAEPTPGRLFR